MVNGSAIPSVHTIIISVFGLRVMCAVAAAAAGDGGGGDDGGVLLPLPLLRIHPESFLFFSERSISR